METVVTPREKGTSVVAVDVDFHALRTSKSADPQLAEDEWIQNKTTSNENPLDTAGFLSFVTVWWLHPLLRRGFETPLDEASVWDLPASDQAHPLQEKFDSIYFPEAQKRIVQQKDDARSEPLNINTGVWKCVRGTYTVAFGCYMASACLTLLQPILIKAIIGNIEGKVNAFNISSGYVLAVLLGLVAFCGATAISVGQFLTTRVSCNARMIVINTAYRKLLRLSAAARRRMDTGEIITLIGVDGDRVMEAYKMGLWCIVAPLILATVSVLIGIQMGFIVGLVVALTLVLIVFSSLSMARRIGAYRRHISSMSANRVKLTNEILHGIRVIKLYGWEDIANEMIRDVRVKEIALLRKFNNLRLTSSAMMFLAPTLLNLVCFSATILLGNTLDVSSAFFVMALTTACQNAFSVFADATVALAEAITSTKRLTEFLSADEVVDTNKESNTPKQLPLVSIENGDFQWEEDAVIPTLSNINLILDPQTLTVVVGAVGSGKSSLVNAILGEIKTMRNNVLFGEDYDAIHYRKVIESCQLLPDFEMLDHGDQTEIGERGINLSGGQKARIALARAFYRSRHFDFVVLDDPLSALDVHVANSVFLDGIDGIGLGKTRLLVLNSHYHLLRYAHRVLVMVDGQIAGDGKLEELEHQFPFLNTASTRVSDVSDDGTNDANIFELISKGHKPAKCENVTPGKLITQEDRRVGSVHIQSYIDYLSSSEWDGRVLCGIIIVLFSIAQIALFSCDWFLSRWSRGSVSLSQMNSLAVYAGIVTIAVLLVTARCFFLIQTCMTCSIKVHFKYLRKVLVAPIPTFFDVTPIGRILNRFSRDLDEVDNQLPYGGLWLLLCAFQVASSFCVCAAVNPFVLFMYIPVGYGCWFAAKVYLSSALELKRLDGVSRSPFLNLVSETISGLDTVRSYNMTGAFAKRCEELLNNNMKFYFIIHSASRWFDMRTDWFISVIIGTVALLAVATKSTVGASVAGLSLTYAAQLSSSFQRMTTLSTRVENSMTSFERIAHYKSLDEEGDQCVPTNEGSLPPAWPRSGDIVFEKVTLRYRKDLPIILKDVSFFVKSGEKVGICGRTGSGKSSLMSVLFRVVEIPNGGRVLIDNVDISTITVQQLRSKLTIIPQDPMLFSGSLRMNLNPFADKSDAELWEVLRKVHLHDTVAAWGKGLDYEVAEKGDNLSIGQRQLLCIARALIRDSKVIVMDEATANVDQESDKLIQQTMKERFGNTDQTVLCIAHRIETIMDSDKILVLDAGQVVEYDSPSTLLQLKNGAFRSLVTSGNTLTPTQ
ncbi:hypothetical protein F444_11030 [Phytophthora nicotianae P1976]|uniref:Uncharacterized protein n=2 Tax=Phytophthora nicotianae TaxID=4792 RepID=A0A081A271_PHYNI|nr:hypothetical protein F444_11030 [Phytophthora nicotianae P1976]